MFDNNVPVPCTKPTGPYSTSKLDAFEQPAGKDTFAVNGVVDSVVNVEPIDKQAGAAVMVIK